MDATEQLALQLSSFAGYKGQSESLASSLVTCHALEVSGQLCMRVNSIASFMEGNRLVRGWRVLCAYTDIESHLCHSFLLPMIFMCRLNQCQKQRWE